MQQKTKQRGNGTGTVYKRGNSYRAQLTRYEGGKRLTKTKSGFRTKREAYEWCALNSSFAVEHTSPTFAQVYNEWSAAHYSTISEKKANSYKHVYESSTALYGKKFNEIGIRHFQAIVNEQKDSYYARKLYKSVYSMMSDYAVRCGYTAVNYAELIELPKMSKPDKRPYTPEEVEKVIDYYNRTGNLFAGSALIMIFTGMRWGEISTIKPEHIHVDEGYLTGGIKTDAGKQGEILLIPEIRPIVRALMLPENRIAAYTSEGFRKGYNKMLADAGVDRHTVHECRHTTATMLAHVGVQPAIISAIMRHTSYTQTMEYTHVAREIKTKNLQKIYTREEEKGAGYSNSEE